jgi:spore coat polysaccharide biosynthesis predicted glycosyltransferase SpsG
MRCRAIASRLGFAAEGTRVIASDLPAGLAAAVRSWGWSVTEIGDLPPAEDAQVTSALLDSSGGCDALLIDHYGLDAAWERQVSAPGRLRVVVDDLGDRRHECEILINPSLGAAEPAAEGAPGHPAPLALLGPRFAPLDPAYDRIRPKHRDGRVHDLLVFLGGATRSSDLGPLIDALTDPDLGIERATIVLGHAFPDGDDVRERAAALTQVTVLDRVESMLPLLEEADLAIGAPGGAQWERCAAGLPTLTVLTHPNQVHDCSAFEAAGATRHLGALQDMTAPRWHAALAAISRSPEALTSMGNAAARLVDGREQAWADARATVASRLETSDGGQP